VSKVRAGGSSAVLSAAVHLTPVLPRRTRWPLSSSNSGCGWLSNGCGSRKTRRAYGDDRPSSSSSRSTSQISESAVLANTSRPPVTALPARIRSRSPSCRSQNRSAAAESAGGAALATATSVFTSTPVASTLISDALESWVRL
jgi:hypothetical protein